MPAPEGEHQVTLEDGTQKLIVVDGNGVLSDIQDVMEEEVVIEPTDNTELKAEVAEIMQKFIVDSNERFVAIENENKTLKVKLEAIAEGSKFKVTPKVIGGEDEKMTIKDILNNKK